MSNQIRMGVTVVLFSYLILIVMLPAEWFPWYSPLNMAGIWIVLLLIFGAIFGGALISYDISKSRSFSILKAVYTISGPVLAVSPAYLYVEADSFPSISPLFLMIFWVIFPSWAYDVVYRYNVRKQQLK